MQKRLTELGYNPDPPMAQREKNHRRAQKIPAGNKLPATGTLDPRRFGGFAARSASVSRRKSVLLGKEFVPVAAVTQGVHDQSAATIFLFTDIEGSTRLWDEEPERMRPALASHDTITRRAVEDNRGIVVKMTGGGVHAAAKGAVGPPPRHCNCSKRCRIQPRPTV